LPPPVGWVSGNPEITPPSNFHQLRDTTGANARATLTKALNAGHRVAAADAFLNWRRPAAIIPRRKAERDMFRHGRYPGGSIPVWAVDRGGRVDFLRPIRRLTEAEALDQLRPQPASPAPAAPQQPATAPGWLARLTDLFTTLIRRV
jgi:lysozyme